MNKAAMLRNPLVFAARWLETNNIFLLYAGLSQFEAKELENVQERFPQIYRMVDLRNESADLGAQLLACTHLPYGRCVLCVR